MSRWSGVESSVVAIVERPFFSFEPSLSVNAFTVAYESH